MGVGVAGSVLLLDVLYPVDVDTADACDAGGQAEDESLG